MAGVMPGQWAGARMPIPGNAEFFLWLVVEIIFVIIWIAADSVNTQFWTVITTVTTSFYLLSRGIAKASRVLEQ
jgi:nicotinamide riboside transporter PnuC